MVNEVYISDTKYQQQQQYVCFIIITWIIKNNRNSTQLKVNIIKTDTDKPD